MSKKDAIVNLVLSLIGISGAFITGYWGGILTGACLTMILLVTIGRRQANKAASRIDKKVRDIILNRE